MAPAVQNVNRDDLFITQTVYSSLHLVITFPTLQRHNVGAFWYPHCRLNRRSRWNFNFWYGSGQVTYFSGHSCASQCSQFTADWLHDISQFLKAVDHHSRGYETYSWLIMFLYLPAPPLCVQSSMEFCGSGDQSAWAAWPNTIDRGKAMQSWSCTSMACYLSISLGQREAWLFQN